MQSHKRSYDKDPWKSLDALDGVIETEFIRPVLIGESVLPFRIAGTFHAVLPIDSDGLMDGASGRMEAHDGLSAWWQKAEAIWEKHRRSSRLSLTEQLDFQKKLQQQLPIQPERIVYNASGMHLVAARLKNRRAIVEHALYWATAGSTAEAHYLCAILNSVKVTELVRPLMSYGKDERHFDKNIWQLPIPLYNPADDLHIKLSARGAELEAAVATIPVDPQRHFPAARRDIRVQIAGTEAGQEIETLVEELLS